MQDIRIRYEAKVDRRGSEECWPWLAATIKGYGYASQRRPVIRRDRKTIIAARLGWELAHGSPPPVGMYVLHRCDNGICMNPGHWFLGTKADNTADMMRKGRNRAAPRKTTPEQDDEIRQLIAGGASQTEVAQRFGVTRIVVARVLGLAWAAPKFPG